MRKDKERRSLIAYRKRMRKDKRVDEDRGTFEAKVQWF